MENEISSPDISLLPSLSVFFGITIDELFSITNEKSHAYTFLCKINKEGAVS